MGICEPCGFLAWFARQGAILLGHFWEVWVFRSVCRAEWANY